MKIAMFAGRYTYWGDIDPDDLFNPKSGQIGGGETAVLNIALNLVAAGHEVYVGAPCAYPATSMGVRMIPVDQFLPVVWSVPMDVVVAWDSAELFRFNFEAGKKVVAYHFNDTQVGSVGHVIDGFFHPSNWHAKRFAEVYGVPEAKQISNMTNGVDTLAWAGIDVKRKKQVIYCSSPDRGLHHLLRMWPAVRERVPGVELHVYYDMKKWINNMMSMRKALAPGFHIPTYDRAEYIHDNFRMMTDVYGVTFHGGVSKAELRRALLTSAVLAYPCDPVAPTEGYSMTILDAYMAGCSIVTTDADALPELWGGLDTVRTLPLPVDDGLFVDAIISGLTTIPKDGVNLVDYKYTWYRVVQDWIKYFETS